MMYCTLLPPYNFWNYPCTSVGRDEIFFSSTECRGRTTHCSIVIGGEEGCCFPVSKAAEVWSRPPTSF